jgi:glycosyltransferase involved in cell wall biosynthesis
LKIDLVIWTKDGEKTLVPCLKSIERAIGPNQVNQKIAVDGHSKDNTKAILKQFGWTVYDAEKVGIQFQAKQAISLVETPFFASFEQDIILNPRWFQLALRHFYEKENVAVVQGVRISLNRTLRIIEAAGLDRKIRYSSIDNNLYRTDIIKSLDLPSKYPLSFDRALQDLILDKGFKWIVDDQLVSLHNKQSFIRDAKKICNDITRCKYMRDNVPFSRVLKIFAFSWVRGAQMGLKSKYPLVIFAYPYYRWQSVKAYFSNITKEN